MALRQIVKIGEPVLRKKSKVVKEINDKIIELLDDMADTMYDADGVGLAAPQVGMLRRVCVVEACGMYLELINPVILKSSGKQCGEEGCLSVKNVTGLVERPQTIKLEAYNRFGSKFTMEVSDFMAVVCSHEIDHLDGILFIDKAKELYRVK